MTHLLLLQIWSTALLFNALCFLAAVAAKNKLASTLTGLSLIYVFLSPPP